MNEPTLDRLTKRLDRLERENHRLKLAGAILLLALAAVGTMGQVLPKPKVVEAERFVLRDTSGRIRAVLGLGADGTPGLDLRDQNGKFRAGLSVKKNGPSLVLRDKNEKARAVLGHTALEATATGTVQQRPASSLVLFDKDGKVLWKAP